MSYLKFLCKSYNVCNLNSDLTKIKNGLYCLDIENMANFKNLFTQKSLLKNINENLRCLRFTSLDWKFEQIVQAISKIEDTYDISINSIDINISDINKRLFLEILDFYSYDMHINLIASNDYTPFEIINNVFSSPEINHFYHHIGISLDINKIDKKIWYSSSILKSIQDYIFAEYDSKTNIYYTR